MTSIFLSYSSKDATAVTRLREQLVAHGYPTVFQDRDEEGGIPGGTKWAAELFGSLERADAVVFLASEPSLASPWCHTELAVAVAQGKFIVQVSLAAEPTHPLLVDRQRIPPDPSVDELAKKIVLALSRAGMPPGDRFEWDLDRSPYPGLARFDDEHAAVLFGRDTEVQACLQRLRGSPVPPLLVTGPSGSGKSSMVRAGVLPRLRVQPATSAIVVVEPGNAPLQRIAIALSDATAGSSADRVPVDRLVAEPAGYAFAVDTLVARGGNRVVLFLDQAEDLVERAPKDEVAEVTRRFAAVDPARLVVITAVRSVSLDDWLREPALGPLAETDPVWVRPMDRAALRDVITGPAHVVGIRFEPASVVDTILDDTGTGNALPLLAALLEELTASHSRMNPAVVTADQYTTVGPVERVIERRAQLASSEIAARRGVPESAVVDAYLRLAQVDDQGRVTAAEVPVAELPEGPRGILLDLQSHRLVTLDQRVVASAPGPTAADEVTVRPTEVVRPVHEAVFRAWPAVAAAIRERRADLETRSWLARDAQTWATSGRGTAVLAGGRLSLARDWSKRHPDEVTQEVHAYVAAAVIQGRLRRVLTVAVPILAGVAVVVGALAFQAIHEADRADTARTQADAFRLAGDARQAFESRPDLGYLLAMEAAARTDDLQLRAAPLIGFARGPGPRSFEAIGSALRGGRLDDAGVRAVLSTRDGVLLWDVVTGAKAGSLPAAEAVGISGDGSTVATGADGELRIGPWPSGGPAKTCPVSADAAGILKVAPSRTGGQIAVAWAEGPELTTHVAVFNSGTCARFPIDWPGSAVTALDVDEARDLVAIAGTEKDVPVLWQVSKGASTGDGPTEPLNDVDIGETGSLAGITPVNGLELWDLDDLGAEPLGVSVATAGRDHGTGAAIAADGETVATTSESGQLRAVHLPGEAVVDRPLLALPPTGTRQATPLDVATDGTRATTIDPNGRLIVWDLAGRTPLGRMVEGAGDAKQVVALDDGTAVAATATGATEVGPDGRVGLKQELGPVRAIATDGHRWAIAAGDSLFVRGPTGLTLAVRGQLPQRATALAPIGASDWAIAMPDGVGIVTSDGAVREVPITPGPRSIASVGRSLYVGDAEGGLHIIDLQDLGASPRSTKAHETDVASMAVSPDGRTLATGSDDRTIALWTINPDGSLTERARLGGNEERVRTISFSPDGHWLVSGSDDSLVRLYSLDLGAQVGDPIPTIGFPSIAFDPSADRRLLVAGAGLERWDLRQEAWPGIACSIIGSRRLTAQEQAQYLHDVAPRDVCG